MDILKEAPSIVQGFLRRHEKELDNAGYINRTLYREGINIDEATAKYYLLGGEAKDDDIIEDSALGQHPNSLLIGNAGTGKSLTLKYAFTKAAEAFLHDQSNPLPLYLYLKELGSSIDIASALDRRNEGLFSAVLSSQDQKVVLFFDALDEILVHNPQFIDDLLNFLEDHSKNNCSAVIACRRPFYRKEWFDRRNLEYKIYHIDYLDREVYSRLMTNRGHLENFFLECHDKGIDFLLDSPFDGFFLARRFVQRQPLPQTRIECLQIRIEEKLKGHGEGRFAPFAPPISQMKLIAANIACLEAFSGLSNWTEQTIIDALGTCDSLNINANEISITLQRPLFIKEDYGYRFSHQLEQEYLVAENLSQISLRKQRQLLEASSGRICTRFRGIATFLVSLNQGFYQHLLENDPIVVFLSEAGNVFPSGSKNLLGRIIDDAIKTNRPPWREVPPHGARLEDHLARHIPQDIKSFIYPYLTSHNEMDELWATACLNAWGGFPELNQEVKAIAFREEAHVWARVKAISAINQTGDKETIRQLFPLLEDPKDEVRGQVMEAYWKQENPSPMEFFSYYKMKKGQPDLLCRLETVIWDYCYALDRTGLKDAFEYVDSEFDSLTEFLSYIIPELLDRAKELAFDEIPATMIIKIFKSPRMHIEHQEGMEEIIRKSPRLLEDLWKGILSAFREKKEDIYAWEPGPILGKLAGDIIFDLLPPSMESLAKEQVWFIEEALQHHLLKEPTEDRLKLFQQNAGPFGANLFLPKPPEPPHVPNIEQAPIEMDTLLNQKELNSIAKYSLLMNIMAKYLGKKSANDLEESTIIEFIRKMSNPLQKRIKEVFRGCVNSITYERKPLEGSSISMTPPEFEKPFQILLLMGENFSTDKICEIIHCYSFLEPSKTLTYISLLQFVRKKVPVAWEKVVHKLLDDRVINYASLVNYLIGLKADIYIRKAMEGIQDPKIDRNNLYPLTDYIKKLKPEGHIEALLSSYRALFSHRAERGTQHAHQRNDFMKPLYCLLELDVDEAWQEFDRLIGEGEGPINDVEHLMIYNFKIPRNPDRLQTLGNWYIAIRRGYGEEFLAARTLDLILGGIQTIGGQPAIDEIRRIIALNPFPNTPWLHDYIDQIEDRMLDQEVATWCPEEILSFINNAQRAIIHNEKDLFEWTVEALYSLKEGIELLPEGVQMFWDCKEPNVWSTRQPKTEPNIQGVLWPRLKDKLNNLGVTAIEERKVGPDSADFWIEHPRPMKVP